MTRFIYAFIAVAILVPATASAADVRETACKTTKECQEESNRIRGVIVKPMGTVEVLRDRAGEWLAFEGWTGTSINTITGRLRESPMAA